MHNTNLNFPISSLLKLNKRTKVLFENEYIRGNEKDNLWTIAINAKIF